MFQEKKYLDFVIGALVVIAGAAIYFAWPPATPVLRTPPPSLSAEAAQATVDRLVIVDGADYEAICRNNIASNKALASLEPKECAKLDDRLMLRADCERQVVMKALRQGKDVSVCSTVASVTVKSECETRYWSSVADKEKSSASCDKLSPGTEQASCRNNYLL